MSEKIQACVDLVCSQPGRRFRDWDIAVAYGQEYKSADGSKGFFKKGKKTFEKMRKIQPNLRREIVNDVAETWLPISEVAAPTVAPVETVKSVQRTHPATPDGKHTGYFVHPNKRGEIFALIDLEREAQKSWRTGRPVEGQYKFAAPHVLLLEEQVAKLRANWYGAKDESTLTERLLKVAAIAVRALEEIEITR